MKNLKGSVKVTATVIAICFLSSTGSFAHPFLFDQFYLYDVPYFSQDDPYWCGPASMSMILGYWGTNVSQEDIAAEICRGAITYIEDMVSYPTAYGFISQDFTGSIYDLKTWIDDGVPLIVLQRFSLEDPYGHYRVVVGYNDSSAMIFTFDPIKGMNFTISYVEFTQLWQPIIGSTFSTINWTLAITPENDVFIELMKQHQIDMNLQLSNYEELIGEIEELRNELRQVRDEATFYVCLFATTTTILIVITISLGIYIATRKPKVPSPESHLET